MRFLKLRRDVVVIKSLLKEKANQLSKFVFRENLISVTSLMSIISTYQVIVY